VTDLTEISKCSEDCCFAYTQLQKKSKYGLRVCTTKYEQHSKFTEAMRERERERERDVLLIGKFSKCKNLRKWNQGKMAAAESSLMKIIYFRWSYTEASARRVQGRKQTIKRMIVYRKGAAQWIIRDPAMRKVRCNQQKMLSRHRWIEAQCINFIISIARIRDSWYATYAVTGPVYGAFERTGCYVYFIWARVPLYQ